MGKTRIWFNGLSRAGKVGAVSLASLAVIGTTAAVAGSGCETTYANNTVVESISFPTTKIKDASLNVGESKVQKPGQDGKKRVTYRIGKRCGDQVSKQAVKTVYVASPTAEERLVGVRQVATETQEVAVPFTTQSVPDDSLEKGKTVVAQAGKNGTKKIIYQVIKVDGQEQSRSQVSEQVTLAPVPQITHYGTKTAVSSSNCDPNYSPCIPYYSGNALNCGDIRTEVRVIGVDHNRFDADGDGYGCESY